MRIRTAAPSDASAVAALISLAYRVEDFFTIGDRTDEDDVRTRMKKSTFLVLEDGSGAMAGCVYVDIRGDTGYFGMLSVDPARQGQGLGSRLIDAAEKFCRDARCRVMEIEVVNIRTELPAFYRRFGYAETGTRPFTTDERTTLPCHFIVMTKALTAA
jgi:GNAT superfamily N-acetyltransferase